MIARRPGRALALAALVALAATGAASCDPGAASGTEAARRDDKVREAAPRAARWLWSRQGEDGGWHSAAYGLLRSGSSLTGFVLSALLHVPEEVVPAPVPAVRRALAFLRRNQGPEGGVGLSDPALPDYPTYATALALAAFRRAQARGLVDEATAAPVVGRLAAFLRGRQVADDTGWRRADPPYGAWGMGTARHGPPDPGHVDLSMTRFALEALVEAGAVAEDRCFARAAVFLDRLRNEDGGYVFSTVESSANKAGPDGDRYRSYGTTTADALLSLAAMRVHASDPRVQGAVAWLVAHHSPGLVPGFPPSEARWETGMLHYYRAASAAAFGSQGVVEAPRGRDWRRDLLDALGREQRADGSFRNESFLMKEDDPLVATTFALSALVSARRP